MDLSMPVLVILLGGVVVAAVLCVLLQDLLKASVSMAFLSAMLSIIMFVLNAPLAAVLELSVCAGLITVIFISAISLTKPRTKEEEEVRAKDRRRRFALLPVILITIICAVLIIVWPRLSALFVEIEPAATNTVSAEFGLFEGKRLADLLGQVIIVLAGVFGVLIFFKEEDVK